MSWKCLTDNRLGLFGLFMAAFFPPGWFLDTPAFHHGYTGFLDECYRHNKTIEPREIFVADLRVPFIAVPRGDIQGSGGEPMKVAMKFATKALLAMQMRSATTPCRRPALQSRLVPARVPALLRPVRARKILRIRYMRKSEPVQRETPTVNLSLHHAQPERHSQPQTLDRLTKNRTRDRSAGLRHGDVLDPTQSHIGEQGDRFTAAPWLCHCLDGDQPPFGGHDSRSN